jgi:hypothetical protein
MKKQDAIDNLVKGATNTNSTYITVTREHLLIALGAVEEKEDEVPSVVAEGK